MDNDSRQDKLPDLDNLALTKSSLSSIQSSRPGSPPEASATPRHRSPRLSDSEVHEATSLTTNIYDELRTINRRPNKLSSGPVSPSKWTCSSCTYDNWPNANRCTMCRAIRRQPATRTRRNHQMAIGSQDNLPEPSLRACARGNPTSPGSKKWACRFCTYDNWPNASRCVICQTPAPLDFPEVERSKMLGDNKSVGLQMRQIRNQLTDDDWVFLNACRGVLDDKPEAVETFLQSGGDVARQLTMNDILILKRLSSSDVGSTLVHIALRFQRDAISAILLSPVSTKDALKRLPCHVNEDLACVAREHAASCLWQRKGDWPCQFMTENVLFSLPGELRCLSKAAQQSALDDILDKDVMKELEEPPPVINWSFEVSKFYPLWNRTAGDCLLDSLMQATWGILDQDGALRKALYQSLKDGASRFYPRWLEWEKFQANALHYAASENQWRREWDLIVSSARRPGVALEQIHVFVLAHVLRRPIIIYGVKYVKSFRGEMLDLAKFEGVYLPLLWETSFCFKSPVALAYTRGHFSALVCMDGGGEDEGSAAQASFEDTRNRRGYIHWLPLVDHQGTLLPVHFLESSEWGNEERLLRQWLQCQTAPSGLMVARQKRCCPGVVTELLDEWLQKYRHINLSETGEDE